MLSTKMKIILTVFGLIVLLFAIQAAVGYVTTEKKREKFENSGENSGEDEDVPVEKKKKTVKKASTNEDDTQSSESLPKLDKKTDVKNLRLSVLEAVEDVFEKKHPGSDQKSVIFDMLLKKENFEDIKEKYENGEEVKDVVGDFIKKHMQFTHEQEKKEAFNVEKYYTNNSDKKSQKETFTSADAQPADPKHQQSLTALTSQLTSISSQLEKLKKDMETIASATNANSVASPSVAPTPSPAPKAEKFTSDSSKATIEGFENRFNYAAF